MAAIDFKLPRGAILFKDDRYAYEFRDEVGEAHHGLRLFVARLRTLEGDHPRGKVLLKAVGRPSSVDGDRVKRARLKLEEQVRLATYLKHPGIVRVHGLRKVEGTWYVITDYPSGHDVCDLLTIVAECRRWYSPQFALHVGVQVATALEHAHTAKDEKGNPLGIVHRAINPRHLYVDLDGRVRIADFGFSFSHLPGRVTSTVRGLYAEPYACAPEMLLGGRVDARSDLYMLGLVMLELATGKSLLDAPEPISDEVRAGVPGKRLRRIKRAVKRAALLGMGERAEGTIWRAATYTPEDVEAATAKLPEVLRVPLCKLLQRSPSARYQTAGELDTDLRGRLGEGYGAREASEEMARAVRDAGDEWLDLDRVCRPSEASA